MKRLIAIFMLLGLLISAQEVLAQDYPDSEEFVFVDQQPTPINLGDVRAAIGYPQEAVDSDIEGTVVCRVLVDSQGNFVRHLVMGSPASVLQKAVDAQINQLKFTPARLEGKAMSYWVNVPFRFKLISEQTKQLEELVTTMTDSLTGMQEDYNLWYRRGLVYLRLNNTKEALTDVEESIRLNPMKNAKKAKKNTYPSLIKSTFAKAAILNKDKDKAGAIYQYSEVLRLAEEMRIVDASVERLIPQTYLERGFIYIEQDSFSLAKKDLKEAIKDTGDLRCTAFQLLADLGIDEKAFEDLVVYYDGLIDCYPDQDLLKYSRGYYASRAGQFEKAIKDFEFVSENIKMRELQLATFNQLGYSYLKMKNYDKALEYLDKTHGLNVLNGEAYYYKGLVYMEQGMTQKACDNIKKSLNYSTEGEYRTDAIEKMKEMCGGWEEDE